MIGRIELNTLFAAKPKKAMGSIARKRIENHLQSTTSNRTDWETGVPCRFGRTLSHRMDRQMGQLRKPFSAMAKDIGASCQQAVESTRRHVPPHRHDLLQRYGDRVEPHLPGRSDRLRITRLGANNDRIAAHLTAREERPYILSSTRQEVFRKASCGSGVTRTSGRSAFDTLGSIGAENGSAQLDHFADSLANGRHRAVTCPAEPGQQGTFRHRTGAAFGVIDSAKQIARPGILGATFEPDRPLSRGGQPFLRIEPRSDPFLFQPVQSGSRQQSYIRLPRLQFGEPCSDIAAEPHNSAIGTMIEHLRSAPGRARTDPRALRNRRQRCCPDKHIGHVGAWQNRTDGDFGGTKGFDILHRMYRGIDSTIHQPGVEFLGPQRLAADFGQRPILNPVACRDHAHQFYRVFGPAMRGAQSSTGLFRLGHSKWGSARPQTEFDGISHLARLP